MSNIRSRKVVAEQLWDWAFLNSSLRDENGGQAKVSDGDGWIEQWEHLLALEGKPSGYRWPPRNAQRRQLEVFASKPGQLVIVWYGKNPDAPDIEEVECRIGGKWLPRTEMTTQGAQSLVRQWFLHARSGCSAASCSLTFRDIDRWCL